MARVEGRRGGLTAVLVATAIAGVVGYAIQLSAPSLLSSDTEYVSYSVFWSTLYLGGAAISGVQQEVARSTHPRVSGASGGRVLFAFGLAAVVIVAIVASAAGMLVGDAVFTGGGATVTLALTVGLVGYTVTSVLTGLYYGLHLWSAVAMSVIADALIRAVLVIGGLLLGWNVGILAILTATPFALAATLTWLIFRRRVTGAARLDVRLKELSVQAASTVVATSASGVMISGLPMLIGLTSTNTAAATTGALLLAVTVTRAPIVIPVIALQSYLISAVFRGRGMRVRRLLGAVGLVVAGGVLLGGVGWAVGPPLLGLISGGRFRIEGPDLALIVFSAVLVAAMCVTGPALLAVRQHSANTVGWLVAALMTIVLLILPLGETRILVALTAAPALGLAIHGVFLLRRGNDASGEPRALVDV